VGGTNGDAGEAGDAVRQAGGVLFLAEEANHGEAQGADLRLDRGFLGGLAQAAAQFAAEEGVVVAGV
jgi:hypothetical protein